MKRFKKMLSLLLVGVIVVTSLFCGTVTASAKEQTNGSLKLYYQQSGNKFSIFIDNFDDPKIEKYDYYNINLSLELIDLNNDNNTIKYETKLQLYNESVEKTFKLVRTCGNDTKSIDGKYIYYTGVGELTNGIVLSISTDNQYIKELAEIVNSDSIDIFAGKMYQITLSYTLGYEILTGLTPLSSTSTFTEAKTLHKNRQNPITDDEFNYDISSLIFSKISDQTYTGKAIKPSVTVKNSDKTLTKGTDYAVMYEDNVDIGTATVTIFDDNEFYTGEKEITFKILPPKTTLTVKKSGGKYNLSWKAVEGGITKYQIQYSSDGGKTFKNAGTVSAKKTSTSLKLDTSKSYTFRIRSYKTVDGKKYYSAWSKTVKTK